MEPGGSLSIHRGEINVKVPDTDTARGVASTGSDVIAEDDDEGSAFKEEPPFIQLATCWLHLCGCSDTTFPPSLVMSSLRLERWRGNVPSHDCLVN